MHAHVQHCRDLEQHVVCIVSVTVMSQSVHSASFFPASFSFPVLVLHNIRNRHMHICRARPVDVIQLTVYYIISMVNSRLHVYHALYSIRVIHFCCAVPLCSIQFLALWSWYLWCHSPFSTVITQKCHCAQLLHTSSSWACIWGVLHKNPINPD